LPPETRTAGQVVAETLRLYGSRFFPCVSLGIGPAAVGLAATYFDGTGSGVILYLLAVCALAASYVGATLLVHDVKPTGRSLTVALVASVAIYLPVPALTAAILVPAVLWLALVGLVVPVVLIEGLDVGAAFRRAVRLGRIDFSHMTLSLAALWILVVLMVFGMSVLIRTGSGETARIAVFLSTLVLTPITFLGGALLYSDQAARARARPS
jgi:hypothetical protein